MIFAETGIGSLQRLQSTPLYFLISSAITWNTSNVYRKEPGSYYLCRVAVYQLYITEGLNGGGERGKKKRETVQGEARRDF
jgi:hypothetical protein